MSTTTSTETRQKFGVSSEIPIPRGPIETSLNFFAPPTDGDVPYLYVEDPPAGKAKSNYGTEVHNVTIHDIRGREHEFDMNVNGFSTIRGVSGVEKDFTDEDQIKKNYYPEVEKLILDNISGSHRVFIFDHTIRRAGPDAKRGPVNRAHIDQTSASAAERVRYHMGDEAEELLKGRVRLINVWRPLNGPVVASPLAYADSQTVGETDTIPVEHRYPHRTGYTAGVKHTDQTKWYYLSGMTNDERIFLQCWDNKDGARTPHSAFVDSRTQPDWPGRESIEVRTLVFG